MRTFRQFDTLQQARDYRHEHGTGGWIFAPDAGGAVTLFPPDMPPSQVFRHPFVAGLDGRLIGSM